jgi:uncharacterized damage-inducible protein DinB
MNHSDLKTLLEYHYWARDRMLESVEPLTPAQWTKDLGSSFPSIRDTVAHLHAAEWAWHSRWNGTSPTALLPADRFADVAAVRAAWADLETQVRAFVDRLGDAGVDQVFSFTLLNGSPGSAPFWQMVQHLVNHASYHRGQVTTMLRQLGVAPGKPMDMVAFYRIRTQVVK